ncbi:MAG: hypothetical protein ACFB6R_06325 [Alphaproteobacteria bacterium]
MFETLHVSATTLLPSAALWLGFVVALVGLTRGISRGLAWVFLVTGIAVPMMLIYTAADGMAGTCSEDTSSFMSEDASYKYSIVKRNCLSSPGAQFEVRIGKVNDLGPLQTVFLGDRSNRPVKVERSGSHEFQVQLVAAETDSGAAKHVTIRLDPQTGQPTDMFDFRQAS